MRFKVLGFVIAAALASGACRKGPEAAAQASTAAVSQKQPAGTAAVADKAGAPDQPPAATPPKPVPTVLPDVVARVNGEAVKKADFERMIHTIEQRAGQPIPPDRRDEVLRGALDQLVVYTLLSQESRNRNIQIADAEVDQKVQQLKSQFPTQDAFDKALAVRGMTLDSLKHDARVDLSVSRLMDAEMSTQPGASDEEAKTFYDKNPERFKQDESVRASHILIRVDEKADAAAKKKARAEIESVLKEARAGADFAKLAQEHSQDGSAAQGGDLNYFSHGQMVPAFEQAAFALKPGQISDVVTTQFGFHIIKVADHKAPRTVSYDEASAQIKQFLTEQKKQQHADAFIAGLKKKSRIEVLI